MKMENQKKIKTSRKDFYRVSDLKLQAFLREMSPSSFVGVNKGSPKKVLFLFEDTSKVRQLAEGYFQGKKFKMSPLGMATNLDLGKSLIYGDFEM